MAASKGLSSDRAWLKAAFAGNARLPDDAVRVQIDRRETTVAEAVVRLSWKESSGRTQSRKRGATALEQAEAALSSKSPLEALGQALASRPQDWLSGGQKTPLPGWRFAHTAASMCGGCGGLRFLPCDRCSRTGRVACGHCNQTGRSMNTCSGCGGSGQRAETESFQQWDGSKYITSYRTNYVFDWACQGRGQVEGPCSSCRGSLQVSCGACGGNGRTRCRDCGGKGEVEYEHVRWLEGETEILVDGAGIDDPIHRRLLVEGWPELMKAGDIDVSLTGEPQDSADRLGRRLSFNASVSLRTLSIRAGDEAEGDVRGVGEKAPQRAATPVLAQFLGLTGADWEVARARLAGTRILAEATHAAHGKDGSEAAARRALIQRYGELLGAEGATLAAKAGLATGADAAPRARRAWPLAALGSALAGAAACVASLASWSPEQPLDARGVILMLLAVGVAATTIGWGLQWFWPTWRDGRPVLEQAPVRPSLRSGGGWIAATLVAPFLAAVLVGVTSWATGWPVEMREGSTDRMASTTLPQATTTAAVRLRQGPSTATPSLATLSPGSRVTVDETGGGDATWAYVWHEGQAGYVARRYLAPAD